MPDSDEIIQAKQNIKTSTRPINKDAVREAMIADLQETGLSRPQAEKEVADLLGGKFKKRR